MKILVIPELDWIVALQNRVHKLFKRLAQKHEVHVVYFEHEKKGIKKSSKLKTNIILHRPPTIYMKNLFLFYILNAYSIYSYVNKIIRTYNIQIIVTTNFLLVPFGIRAAKKNTIPIVFDLVDFQPYHINYFTYFPSIFKKMGNFLLTSLLNFDIKSVNYVITTGLPLFRYIKRIGQENTMIISNGVDKSLFNTSYNGNLIKKKFNITFPIISFIGALEYWVDYHLIFNSISLLLEKIPNLHCFLIGPSRHYGIQKIKQLAANLKVLNRIIFTGKIPYHKIPAFICASDICILPFVKNYLTHCIIPMKLFEYLACERPVISVPLVGVKSVAKNAIFYADTPKELSDIIYDTLTNKQKVQKIIQLGSILLKNYDWNDLVGKYEQILVRIYSNFKK